MRSKPLFLILVLALILIIGVGCSSDITNNTPENSGEVNGADKSEQKYSVAWCLAKANEINEETCLYKILSVSDKTAYLHCADYRYVYQKATESYPIDKTRSIAELVEFNKKLNQYEKESRDLIRKGPFMESPYGKVSETYPFSPNDPLKSSIGENCFMWYDKSTGDWKRSNVNPSNFVEGSSWRVN